MNRYHSLGRTFLDVTIRIAILVALTGGFLAPAGAASAEKSVSPMDVTGQPIGSPSPEGMLNPDGTLRLDGQYSGTLNLSGWNVQMDPQRGPVFSAQNSSLESPQGLSSGAQWRNLGYGGDAITGTVFTVLIVNDYVWLGGNFTNVNGDPTADYFVAWTGYGWAAMGSNGANNGSLNGPVYALAYTNVGSQYYVYAGGNFTDAHNGSTAVKAADYIAMYTNSTWAALGAGAGGEGSINGAVRAIAINGSSIYAGGDFTKVNNTGADNTAAAYVARYNGSGWSSLGSGANSNSGSLNGAVNALAVQDTNLYVGGGFTNVNNKGNVLTAADYITKWDGMNWSAMGGSSTNQGALNGDVQAILVDGTDVYVGGNFTDISQGLFAFGAADYVAKWNGNSWSGLGSNGAGNGALNGSVRALTLIGNVLYIGGSFTNVNNNGTQLPAADHVAQWDGTNWAALGDDGAGNGSIQTGWVYALGDYSYRSSLFVGGSFPDVKNGSTLIEYAGGAAMWNPTSGWSGASDQPTMGALNGDVDAIAVIGSDVYVGGKFTNVNNKGTVLNGADYVAKWDGTDWLALGADGTGDGALKGSNVMVNALAAIGQNLYVGGTFTSVNDNGSSLGSAAYIAEWSGGHWLALSGDGAGGGSLNMQVRALATDGTNLFVGGDFTDVKNGTATPIKAADAIAEWDGHDWSALGSNGAGEGSINHTPWQASIYAIAVSGSNVYVGGDFADVNDGGTVKPAADYVAVWDGHHWNALGSNGAGDGALTNTVYTIAVMGTDVYVGGRFEDVNDNGLPLPEADYLAMWDGKDWSALGSNGAGDGALNSDVLALAVIGTDLYIGGTFNWMVINGKSIPDIADIARWDGSSYHGVGHGDIDNCDTNCYSLNSHVNALAVAGTDLIVGGGFTGINNNGTFLYNARYVAAYGDPGNPPPVVATITRAGASPTFETRLYFTVTFSAPVKNVDDVDFKVTSTGDVTYDPQISVRGPGSSASYATVYTAFVDINSGKGTIHLDLIDRDSIVDSMGDPLGGMGLVNGDFTTGESYLVGIAPVYLPNIQRR